MLRENTKLAGAVAGARVDKTSPKATTTLARRARQVSLTTRRYVTRRLGCGECRHQLIHVVDDQELATQLNRAWIGHCHAAQPVLWPQNAT